mmetsp:Transcript_53097/g.133451  ORF Transcript_53097/g.133451 Transcript_53097/m.133451 type:complete len:106 (-) Transcript_53097:16-333(-)
MPQMKPAQNAQSVGLVNVTILKSCLFPTVGVVGEGEDDRDEERGERGDLDCAGSGEEEGDARGDEDGERLGDVRGECPCASLGFPPMLLPLPLALPALSAPPPPT